MEEREKNRYKRQAKVSFSYLSPPEKVIHQIKKIGRINFYGNCFLTVEGIFNYPQNG
jgi:hypothetical protein